MKQLLCFKFTQLSFYKTIIFYKVRLGNNQHLLQQLPALIVFLFCPCSLVNNACFKQFSPLIPEILFLFLIYIHSYQNFNHIQDL